MCDISVIVTVYNKKQYIEQCVRTLISVCGAVVEIILVDDGSTDGTADILTNIALWDDRIKVIHKENGGASSARLAGLYASKGSYIIFVDADDWIDSDALNLAIGRLSNNIDILVGTWVVHDGLSAVIEKNGIQEGIYREGENKEYFSKNMIYSNSVNIIGISGSLNTKIIKKELIVKQLEAFPKGITYAEDDFVTYACLANADVVVVTNIPFYHYIMRYDSITHNNIPFILTDINKGYQYFLNQISGIPNYSLYKKQIEIFMQRMVIFGMSKYMSLNDNASLDWYQFDRQILQNVNNIIIYGAGRVGKCYYRQFEKDSNINIDAWVDVNYLHYEEAGLPVSSIDIIQNYSDDMIIIAVDNSRAAIQIKKNLLSRFNISEEKMIWIKPKNIIDDMCNELLEDN